MERIDGRGLIAGGLAAGIILNIFTWTLRMTGLDDWGNWDTPDFAHEWPTHWGAILISAFAMAAGFVAAWLCAAMRGRFESGLWAAVFSAVPIWLMSFQFDALKPHFYGLLHLLPPIAALLLPIHIARATAATFAAAFFYRAPSRFGAADTGGNPGSNGGHMVDIRRLILGGLIAGLVLNALPFVTRLPPFYGGWEALLEAGMSHWVNIFNINRLALAILEFMRGLVIVSTYVAIRPRLGAGPGTTVYAGAAIWLLSVGSDVIEPYAYHSLPGFATNQVLSMMAVTLLGVIFASLAGAFFYRDDGEASPATAR